MFVCIVGVFDNWGIKFVIGFMENYVISYNLEIFVIMYKVGVIIVFVMLLKWMSFFIS